MRTSLRAAHTRPHNEPDSTERAGDRALRLAPVPPPPRRPPPTGGAPAPRERDAAAEPGKELRGKRAPRRRISEYVCGGGAVSRRRAASRGPRGEGGNAAAGCPWSSGGRGSGRRLCGRLLSRDVDGMTGAAEEDAVLDVLVEASREGRAAGGA